ncbi:MAG: hypothetical protein L0Z62_18595 [Gemmataceae bacterium]|nr:hypothetical protein [Gemmataceae bacterium]
MRDDTLVSEQALEVAYSELHEHGSEALWGRLLEAEPHLGNYLKHNATLVAGRLALSGAPQPVIEGVHNDLVATCAFVYLALRQGSYEIWQGTALGERLRALQREPEETPAETLEPGPSFESWFETAEQADPMGAQSAGAGGEEDATDR